MDKELIIKKYIEFVLDKGKPISVTKFCKEKEIPEKDFYDKIGSLHRISELFWLIQFEKTLSTLNEEEIYASYSVREKLLAFFFTFFENIKEYRSFIEQIAPYGKKAYFSQQQLRLLKDPLMIFGQEIISEGLANGEIVSRKFLDEHYTKGIWMEFLFVYKFWMEDTSLGFEKTDAAIEKSVNLLFEMIGKSPLDSLIDFGKFMYHTVRK